MVIVFAIVYLLSISSTLPKTSTPDNTVAAGVPKSREYSGLWGVLWFRGAMSEIWASGAMAGRSSRRTEPVVSSRRARAHMARFGEGEAVMYPTILLAAALQNWDRYSAHALAAREVAATLAKGASHHLHVLTVYAPPPIDTGNLPAEIATRHREDLMRRTDALMVEKMDEYVAPLKAEGLEVTPILRTGDPREVIVQVATNMNADLLILGSHSKRGLLDIVLGGTAQQVSKSAPCLVVLVSPKKEGGG